MLVVLLQYFFSSPLLTWFLHKQPFLLLYKLSLEKLRGQSYDGASAKQGARSGAATRICEEQPRVVYTHCFGHSINLAANDAIKHTKVMKRAMQTAHEITKLV